MGFSIERTLHPESVLADPLAAGVERFISKADGSIVHQIGNADGEPVTVSGGKPFVKLSFDCQNEQFLVNDVSIMGTANMDIGSTTISMDGFPAAIYDTLALPYTVAASDYLVSGYVGILYVSGYGTGNIQIDAHNIVGQIGDIETLVHIYIPTK